MNEDAPNEFIQTDIPKVKYLKTQVIINITGVLVDMLVEMETMKMYAKYCNSKCWNVYTGLW